MRPGPASEWTPEREALLRELHAKGQSFSQITTALGGISRNGCISKAKRLKLARRETGRVAKPKPAKQFKRHNDGAHAAPRPPTLTPKTEPKPIGPLHNFPPRGACKFIRGDTAVRGWRCCGAPATGAWCSYHRSIIFQQRKEIRTTAPTGAASV